MGDSMSTIINATTTNGVVIQPDNSGSLQLATNSGTTAVTINTSQNVGIGTASPTARLTVSGNQSFVEKTAAYIGVDIATTAGNGGNLTVKAGNGSGSGNTSGNLYVAAGRGGASAASGFIAFGVAQATNAVGLDAEYMRIDSSGNVLVGATSTFTTGDVNAGGTGGIYVATDSGSAPTLTLKLSGGNGVVARFIRGGISASVGNISITTTATAYNTSSDYRLKENITPMTGALAKVALLKPVTYKWKQDGSDGEGFIAHELAEVVPNAVTGEKDAVDEEGKPVYQGIDTSFLVATLTAAIQEQQTIINDLKARIETLEAK
jgi:hypothetical protein